MTAEEYLLCFLSAIGIVVFLAVWYFMGGDE